jgi:hypothetical protein
VQSPAAWFGRDLRRQRGWHLRLTAEQVGDLCRAVERARSDSQDLRHLTAADFPLPILGPEIAAWRRELQEGRGFVLVSGLPVSQWTQAQTELAFWGIGLHLGIPGGQNEEGDLLGHVTDLSTTAEHADERLYRTNKAIRFHCDAADVVGLLCVQGAAQGGLSRLVSSVTVFNHLLATRPDLAARLFEPMLLDARRPLDSPIQYTPVQPCAFDGQHLRTFMHLDYYTSVERHAGVTLDAAARELLHVWEQFAEQPDVHLDMQLQVGDMQLVSNHTVVHARTRYVDEEGSPRHLLRLWLSLE